MASNEDYSQLDISVQEINLVLCNTEGMNTSTHSELVYVGLTKRKELCGYGGKEYLFAKEKDKLVAEVIRYVLFKTHQSSGCPIRREELTQIVTKNYHQRSLPTLVINEARGKLSSIFGFDMKELKHMRPSSNRSAARASQQNSTCREVLPNVVSEKRNYLLQ